MLVISTDIIYLSNLFISHSSIHVDPPRSNYFFSAMGQINQPLCFAINENKINVQPIKYSTWLQTLHQTYYYGLVIQIKFLCSPILRY